MRVIETTNQFKKDFKRELKGIHKVVLASLLTRVVTLLANDEMLMAKYRDHALTGNWSDHRDCHIKSDLVLIYRKLDKKILQLVRLGSHSQLSL